jgi:hypothetical protein
MPEIGMPRNEFVDKVREIQEKDNYVNPFTLDEIAPELEQEIVGSGEISFVLPGSDVKGKETVFAYSYADENPLRMKEIFYAQRIYSTLFPHNFPHFYAAFGKTRQAKIENRIPDNISGTIRQRIFPADMKTNTDSSTSVDAGIKYPFSHVRDVCESIGLPLDIEDSSHNLMHGADGGEYYVDTANPRFDVHKIDIEKVDAYMRDNQFSEQDIHAVHSSIERLKEIHGDLYRY